ncbi:MAG: hypothetical protein WC728_18265 [Elusimicrobiota bacterium]
MAKGHEEPSILLNYPKLNEKITSSDYSFRIESRIGGAVEISIDDGPWQHCRDAAGYWWYDWRVGTPGKHKAVARVMTTEGQVPTTFPRYFHVGNGDATPAQKPQQPVQQPVQQEPVRKNGRKGQSRR